MCRTRILISWALLSTAALTAVRGQQYVISTFAGGAPAAPVEAIRVQIGGLV
jgi:hypothetical protein